jgi:DNA-binding transcriptional LysR family regulator
MDISIGKLQQLVTVSRVGSISRAAVELNLSQPALSRGIALIEEHYGFQIFNRMGHGVELTTAGSQVIAQAQTLLQSMRVFDSNLRLFGSGKAGALSLGLSPLLASQLLAPLARDFFTPDRTVQLRVMIHPGARLLDQLKNDMIEMCFFPEGHVDPSPEIEMEAIGFTMATCVVHSAHPLATRKHLTLEDLIGFPWATSIDPPIISGAVSAARFVCDNYHILREMVLETDLVCICSLAFVSQQLDEGTLVAIQVEDLPLPATTIYMAKLRGRVSSPLAEEALARLRQHLQ